MRPLPLSHLLLLLVLSPFQPRHVAAQGLCLKMLTNKYPDWEPNAVLDIGANVGAWGRLVRESYKNTKLLMLEATPKHEEALQKESQALGNAEHRIVLLGRHTGDEVNFFQDGNTGNSIFKEQSKHYLHAKATPRTTIRLDDVVQDSFLKDEPVIDLIKLDVQGAELLVLEGGVETLAGASFVQLEFSTMAYNQGAPCWFEVDELLRSNGFYLYDFSEINRNPAFGSLGAGQFDVLYVNPSSPRLPAKFRELNGNYCGMNSPAFLSGNTKALLDNYGLLELEQAVERNVSRGSRPLYVGYCMALVALAFGLGVHVGSKRAQKSMRCRQ